MERQVQKEQLREKVRRGLKEVEELLNRYYGEDKVNQEKNFKKCNNLVGDPKRYLKYNTLQKLALYIELARKKLFANQK